MVTQTTIDAERRAQPAERVHDRLLRIRVEGDEVAGKHDHLGLLRVCDGDVLSDLPGRHEGTDVDIGELTDAKTLEGGRQARQPDGLCRGLEIEAPIKETIPSGHKRRPGGQSGRSFQKTPSRR